MAEFVEHAITELLAMGHELGVNGDLGHLSRLQAGEGRVAEALETVERAIGMAQGSGELVQLPELLRLQARYMLQLASGAEEVPARLLTALQQAESQGSPPMALRIADDIAAVASRPTTRELERPARSRPGRRDRAADVTPLSPPLAGDRLEIPSKSRVSGSAQRDRLVLTIEGRSAAVTRE